MDAPEKYNEMFDPNNIKLPPNVPEQFYWSPWDKNGDIVTKEDIRRIRANYYGKIALLDDCVGELVGALKKRGKWHNTMFVYTSDHGEMMGAQGKMSKGKFWEESARVPCVITWPDVIPAGQDSAALCQLFDLFPTFVEAAGEQVLEQRSARSLLPVATGEKKYIRDAVFGEIGRTKPLSFMVREGRYKWFTFRDSHYEVEQNEYLYDLEEDPFEMCNLIDSPNHQEIITKLKLSHLEYYKQNQWNWAAKSQSLFEKQGAASRTKKEVEKKDLSQRMYEKFKQIQGF
jgi:choline-sulfatase